jgi:hypothetical protein
MRDAMQNSGKEKPAVSSGFLGGAYRDRTGDLRLAKPPRLLVCRRAPRLRKRADDETGYQLR